MYMGFDPATLLLCPPPREIVTLLHKGIHCIIASNSGENDPREIPVRKGIVR